MSELSSDPRENAKPVWRDKTAVTKPRVRTGPKTGPGKNSEKKDLKTQEVPKPAPFNRKVAAPSRSLEQSQEGHLDMAATKANPNRA